MSERRPVTRLTLFVPGTQASWAEWGPPLAKHGLQLDVGGLSGEGFEEPVGFTWVEQDGSFAEAFSFGTVDAPVLERLAASPGALVLPLPFDLRADRERVVAIVGALREAGAIAVRIEESMLGWDVDRWLELFSSEDPWAWHRGAVVMLGEEGKLQSCGMHAFSLPDAYAEGPADEISELVGTLNVYQLAEDPLLLSGQTFSTDAESPRRVLTRWPDLNYPDSHPCHNPYGVWRVGPPGGTAREIPAETPSFVPALRVMLLAREKKLGRAMTQAEVEEFRDRCPCVMVSQEHAQTLERARGYADLDPDLVWEQWQAVRAQG